MDQEKIGKLIAKLRKSKGLTQRELGEMVGVGFRAVSKWETGLTSPDISIINDLSKILGISADELLKGEVNKTLHQKQKFNYKNLLYIIPIFLVLILSIVLIIINNNKTEVYKLETTDEEYYIEGEVIFKGNDMSLNISKLVFHDIDFNNTIIKNYQYEIYSDNTFIVGYGYMPTSTNIIISKISIDEWCNLFKVNYNVSLPTKKSKITKDGLILKINFIDEFNKEIEKNIKVSLLKSK